MTIDAHAGVTRAGRHMQVDYLVGCHEGEAERLYLAAGSSQGSVALFEMELADNMSGCSVGKPTAQLCGGHSDVVCSSCIVSLCLLPFLSRGSRGALQLF